MAALVDPVPYPLVVFTDEELVAIREVKVACTDNLLLIIKETPFTSDSSSIGFFD
jgi:hypothetical protein